MVSKVQVVEGQEMRYGVRFPRAAAEVEFRPEEVRARLDLVDGQWVSAEEKVSFFLRSCHCWSFYLQFSSNFRSLVPLILN